jgi:hypothetical protein
MTFTTADHRRYFAEFVRWEKACGGPDPHLAYMGPLLWRCEVRERAWRLGCYLACYNVPTGIALWNAWPWADMPGEGQEEALQMWIEQNWAGLSWRRERRAVRSVPKLTRHLISLADWVGALPHQQWATYDAAWRAADQIWGTGRYMKHKLLEGLYRYCGIGVQLSDIRAKGGWSPRIALALLYPQYAEELTSKGAANDAVAEKCARWAREELAERHGLEVSFFDLQVMLCEYRESAISRRQYPGRSHDSELGHMLRIEHHWGTAVREPFDRTRALCVPEQNRGELHGWAGAREDCGHTLADHGYTWNDMEYDYMATEDFAAPVRRAVLA